MAGADQESAPSMPEAHDPYPGDRDDRDDNHEGSRSRGPLRRNRVHFACTECYRRKQRCNRQIPCQHVRLLADLVYRAPHPRAVPYLPAE